MPLAVGEQNFAGFPALREYLTSGVGFYVRTLAEYSGGVTQLMKSAHALRGLRPHYEIHSYGPTLNLAMYLNVALAVRNCEFAEIMVPQNFLCMGMDDADLPIVDGEGFIPAPPSRALATQLTMTRWRI